jgi:ribosome-associated protein
MVNTSGAKTLTAKHNASAVPAIDADDMSIEDVLGLIKKAIEDRKGEDVRILDLEEQVDYLDYLVVCSGYTEVHNKAIADSVIAELARHDIIAEDLQGYRRGDWILIDFGVAVVHIFLPALRDFYRLEELWSGGQEVKLD